MNAQPQHLGAMALWLSMALLATPSVVAAPLQAGERVKFHDYTPQARVPELF